MHQAHPPPEVLLRSWDVVASICKAGFACAARAGHRGLAPAVAGHDAPLVPVLHGLGGDVAQPARARVAVLVHVEVQVQVTVLGQRENPAAV